MALVYVDSSIFTLHNWARNTLWNIFLVRDVILTEGTMKRIETFIEIIHEMATNICRCPNDRCKGCGDSAVLIQKLCNDIVEIIEQIERTTLKDKES